MRRTDREITEPKDLDQIIQNAQVCRISFARDNLPYIVPVSHGYDGESLYFHTAKSGKKIDFIETNNYVCFEIEGKVELITHPTIACKWSFAYESIIGYGNIDEMTSEEEKQYAMNVIMKHYSGETWEIPTAALTSTRLWKIKIESLSGKRSFEKTE